MYYEAMADLDLTKIEELEKKIDKLQHSIDRFRKIFFWFLIISVALVILPLLGLFGAVIAPFINKTVGQRISLPAGFILVALILLFMAFAIIFCIKALKRGERSWLVWLGSIPAFLVGLFWIFMVIGEFVFPH